LKRAAEKLIAIDKAIDAYAINHIGDQAETMSQAQRYKRLVNDLKTGVIMKSSISGKIYTYNILLNSKYSKLSDIKQIFDESKKL